MLVREVDKCCSTSRHDPKDKLREHMGEMGFEDNQISLAIKRCGLQICSGQEGCVCLQDSMYHLVDFINAHLGETERLDSSTQISKVAIESLEVGSKRLLSDMGFEMNDICRAIDIYGEDSALEVLVDFIATYDGKKESNFMESNLDINKPSSSSVINSNSMPPHYETRDEDIETKDESINLLPDHQQNGTSSESSDEVATKSSDVGSKKLLSDMGFEMNDICHAIDICGEDSALEDLVDFIATYDNKRENNFMVSNLDIDKPHRSSGMNSIIMPPHYETYDEDIETKDENINSLFGYQQNGTSSESSDEEMEMLWAASVPLSGTSSKKKMKRKHAFEEEMEMMWAAGASLLGTASKKKMKRKHAIEEIQELDEEIDLRDNAFYRSAQCPRGMCGFSLPGSSFIQDRTLNRAMEGPPFFYFENIALMPKCEWSTITRFFNGIEPEFVDSIHFSACHRQRGYVHNLPLHGREMVHPNPPMTIDEAFPEKMKFKPWWDTRTKMNCLNTVRSNDTVCRKIADTLKKYGNNPPVHEQKTMMSILKKFNLLWVNPERVAPLDPVEMEILLGFEEGHTRGTSSMTERYKALGNSFQVDTVAYHLSALRALYADGINVLSLFSGIGGAEVALHKAGIPLKLVVSVEGNPKRRDVLTSWWRRTGQRGKLIHRENVQALNYEVLHALNKEAGGFDLVIGGSPCNNLTGSNRVTRVGLEGEHSRLFFEFPRIYNLLKQFRGGSAGGSD